jgi:endonuclease YncB( thermonuclease family)
MNNESLTQILKSIDPDSIELFSLNGLETLGKVVKRYDGDTATIILIFKGTPYKFNVRLLGIDCAEKRSKNPKEVECAYLAMDYFDKFVNDELVFVKCHKWDKYGRLLVEIFKLDTNQSNTRLLNKELVEHNLAYEYSGKTKKKFEEWYLLK